MQVTCCGDSPVLLDLKHRNSCHEKKGSACLGQQISGTVTAHGAQEQSCLILTSDILLPGLTYQKHEKKKIFRLHLIRSSQDVEVRNQSLSGMSHSVQDTILSKLIRVTSPKEISAKSAPTEHVRQQLYVYNQWPSTDGNIFHLFCLSLPLLILNLHLGGFYAVSHIY